MFKLTIQQIGLNGYAAEAISSANNIHMFQKVLRLSQVSAPVPTSRFSEFQPSVLPQLTSLSVKPSPVFANVSRLHGATCFRIIDVPSYVWMDP